MKNWWYRPSCLEKRLLSRRTFFSPSFLEVFIFYIFSWQKWFSLFSRKIPIFKNIITILMGGNLKNAQKNIFFTTLLKILGRIEYSISMISYPTILTNFLCHIFLIELNDQEGNRRMNNGYLNGKSFKKPLSQNPWKKHYMYASLIYRHIQKFLEWYPHLLFEEELYLL